MMVDTIFAVFLREAARPQFVQRVSSIQQLGMNFEIPTTPGRVILDPLYNATMEYESLRTEEDCRAAAVAIFHRLAINSEAHKEASSEKSTNVPLRRLAQRMCVVYEKLVRQHGLIAVPVLPDYKSQR